MARFAGVFEGSVVPIAIDQAAIIARADTLLFTRFETSAARYTGAVRQAIVRELAISRLRNETMHEVGVRLQKRIPHVFGGARSSAARLARTETMNAYNVQHVIAMRDLAKDDPKIRMMWDATRDRRLCLDCRSLDGKVVDPSDEDAVFAARGTTVEHPPLHPNCRCVVVAWRKGWDAPDRKAPVEARPARARKAS